MLEPQSPPMPTQLVGRALGVVRDAGGDADALARRFDLPPGAEVDPFVLMPVPRLQAFLDAAATAAGDPFLGVNIARWRDLPNLLVFACRGAPDLRAALDRTVRYVGAINDQLSILVDEDEAEMRVEMRVLGQALGLGRHGNEYWATSLLLNARRLTGALIVPERAWFTHAAPPDRAELARALGTAAIRFGAESSGFALPAGSLEIPLRTADPALLARIDHIAAIALSRRRNEGPFVARVRQAVLELMPHGQPTLEAAARACGVSARTLQRRLGENGATFREVLDSVRADLSSSYVDDRAMSLQEVATLLGYQGASSLVRAHRRWTGKTPRRRAASE